MCIRDRLSYAQLQTHVAKLAGALQDKGVTVGDRVIIYMPMVPAAIVAMLACARIGAIHSVVFGGFAANELAVRIDDSAPKAILTASCGIEPGRVVAYKPLIDAALELASHKVDFTLILQRPEHLCTLTQGRDFDWHDTEANAAPCLLYTSPSPRDGATSRMPSSA